MSDRSKSNYQVIKHTFTTFDVKGPLCPGYFTNPKNNFILKALTCLLKKSISCTWADFLITLYPKEYVSPVGPKLSSDSTQHSQRLTLRWPLYPGLPCPKLMLIRDKNETLLRIKIVAPQNVSRNQNPSTPHHRNSYYRNSNDTISNPDPSKPSHERKQWQPSAKNHAGRSRIPPVHKGDISRAAEISKIAECQPRYRAHPTVESRADKEKKKKKKETGISRLRKIDRAVQARARQARWKRARLNVPWIVIGATGPELFAKRCSYVVPSFFIVRAAAFSVFLLSLPCRFVWPGVSAVSSVCRCFSLRALVVLEEARFALNLEIFGVWIYRFLGNYW